MNKFTLNNWKKFLHLEYSKPYFKALSETLQKEYVTKTVYPKQVDLFRALELTDVDNIKVVILGQDPYHGKGQADGLAFSVSDEMKLPPSLRNIFKEVSSDLEIPVSSDGNLKRWASQGVLLLNTTLSVVEGNPLSHKSIGWETFTDNLIIHLSKLPQPIVFMLWGKHAQSKNSLLAPNSNHLILCSHHPSPLSAYRGFFGCKHFSKANEFLSSNNIAPIDWS